MDRTAKKANRALFNLIEAGGVFAEQKQRLGNITDAQLEDWYQAKGIIVPHMCIELCQLLHSKAYRGD